MVFCWDWNKVEELDEVSTLKLWKNCLLFELIVVDESPQLLGLLDDIELLFEDGLFKVNIW